VKINIKFNKFFKIGEIFEGVKINSPLLSGNLLFADNESVLYPCCSGGWLLKGGTNRPLDAGKYLIKACYPILKAPFKGKKNYWFAYLEPQFKTDQTQCGIHPDAWPPGSNACCVVKIGQDEEIRVKIMDFLKTGASIEVDVSHSLEGGA
jgi:hypothetical protein